MIVTSGTASGESEPDGRGGFDLIGGIDDLVFFGDCTAFASGGEAAVEAGGDDLIERGLRKKITGDLLDGEVFE